MDSGSAGFPSTRESSFKTFFWHRQLSGHNTSNERKRGSSLTHFPRVDAFCTSFCKLSGGLDDTVAHDGPVGVAVYHAKSSVFLTASSADLKVWDAATGVCGVVGLLECVTESPVALESAPFVCSFFRRRS